MSWTKLKEFPTQFVRPSPFKLPDVDICFYTTSYYKSTQYQNVAGIYMYYVGLDSHKNVKQYSFAAGNYFPKANTSIYYREKHSIIFIGGCDGSKRNGSLYKHLMLYNIRSQTFRKLPITETIGGNSAAIITNKHFLHIICGTDNDYHILYNLQSNKSYNIHSFEARGRREHGLIYNNNTNILYMFGGCSNKIDKSFDDFWSLDLNHPNSQKSMLENMQLFVRSYTNYIMDNDKDYKKSKSNQIQKNNKFFRAYNVFFFPKILVEVISEYVGDFIDEIPLSQWRLDKKRKLKVPLSAFGHILYDNRIIITFGGETKNLEWIKDIYFLDLNHKKKGWKKSKLQMDHAGACNALLINDKTVHVLPFNDYRQHYKIDIDQILPKKLINE